MVVTLQGPQGKHVYTIDKPFARVGAHPRSEIVLPDGPAKRFFLHASDAGIYCLSLEHNPLGRPSFNGWIAPRRAIAVGAYQVNARFADDSPEPDRGTSGHAPSSPPCEEMGTGAALVTVSAQRSVHGTEPVPISSQARPQLELTTVTGRRQTVQLRLRRPLTIVGREPPSKLCLADTSISRAHCILYWDDARLWAIDLFSANGMRIDGRPVEFGSVPPGSGLVLGNILLTHLSAAQGPPTRQRDPETGTTAVLPDQVAVVGSDTLVLSADGAAGDGAIVDGAPVDGAEGCQEPLAADTPCNSKQFGSQRFQTPAPATVDELRREAQQQAEQQAGEWVERSDTLLAELAGLRAELAVVEQERDLAQLQQREAQSREQEAQSRHQQAEQAQAEMSARLGDIERAHRDLELAHSVLKSQLAVKEQLAAELRREEHHRQVNEESAAAREAEDRDSEERVVQRQLVVWQPERKLLIDELVPPPCGELTPASIQEPSIQNVENGGDLDAGEVESANTNDSPPALMPRNISATKTYAAGEDELFDQLVSTQARQATTRGRRRLLATAALGGTVVLALGAVVYFSWQPLVRLLNL